MTARPRSLSRRDRPRPAPDSVVPPRQGAPAVVRPASALALGVLGLAGCAGEQSALAPAGEDAAALARLFFVMLWGAGIIWLLINGAFFYLRRINPHAMDRRLAGVVVVTGGVVLPLLLLGALLTWGLSILPDHRRAGDGLTIRVTGEQWWWRVEYWPAGADAPVVSANEIRMPVGERVEFRLDASRVIHSFWIPALGGKLDMFPGRETRFSLKATEAGTWRGQCAEFCGESHAWMAFQAVAMPRPDFDSWLAAEAAGAGAPGSPAAQRGADLFAREGCGACHAVRGTEHVGRVGPDLTHVGGRLSLGAARLGTAPGDFARWIADPQAYKPGVEMPGFPHLSADELSDLAAYLTGLD